MKISGFKRIIKEDLPEEFHTLVDKLGYSINPFADEVINALNKNLTVDDNLNMQYKDIDLKVDASGIPIGTVSFKSTLKTRLRGIIVVKAENLENPGVYPTSHPFISFSENNNLVTLNHITGLQTNVKYRLRLETRG